MLSGQFRIDFVTLRGSRRAINLYKTNFNKVYSILITLLVKVLICLVFDNKKNMLFIEYTLPGKFVPYKGSAATNWVPFNSGIFSGMLSTEYIFSQLAVNIMWYCRLKIAICF